MENRMHQIARTIVLIIFICLSCVTQRIDSTAENDTHMICSYSIHMYNSYKISPSPYDENSVCKWDIESDDNTSIVFKFLTFNISEDDAIIINDDSGVIWTFSYTSTPLDNYYAFSSHHINIVFRKKTNCYLVAPFNLELVAQRNGGYFVNDGNIIYSKGHEENVISKKSFYLFKEQNNKQVKIHLSNFEGFPSKGIAFYDSQNIQNLVAKFQDNTDVYSVFSPSNIMLMIVEDHYYNCSFKINYYSVTKKTNTLSQERDGSYQISNAEIGTYTWIIQPSSISKKEQISLKLISLFDIDGNSLVIQSGLPDETPPFLTVQSTDIERTIFFPSNKGIKVMYNVKNLDPLPPSPLLSMNYFVIPECIYELTLSSHDEPKLIASPGYPSNYPFAATCHWSISSKNATNFLHLSFKDINVHPAHNFSIQTNEKSDIPITSDDDLIILTNHSVIKWATNLVGIDDIPYKGFKLAVQAIDCGSIFTESQNQFKIPEKLSASTHCLWKIDVSQTSNSSNIILNIYSTDPMPLKGLLTVYDGGKLSSRVINYDIVNGVATVISRGPKLLVEYLSFDNHDEETSIFMNYTQHECLRASDRCENGICMHPDWKCNGINDCGDNSDELNCLYRDCGNPDTILITKATNISLENVSESILDCYWKFKAHEKKSLYVKIHDLKLNHARDVLLFNDGKNSSYPLLKKLTNTSENFKDLIIVTSDQDLSVNLFSDEKNFIPNFLLEIIPQDIGGYIYGNKSNLVIKQQVRNDVAYFIMKAEPGKQIQIGISVSNPSLPNYMLCFYDKYTTQENKLACFHSSIKIYSIVSSSDELIVTAKNFYGYSFVQLNVENIPRGTNFIDYNPSGSLTLTSVSPNIYIWRIRPNIEGIIILTIKQLNLYKKESVTDSIQIYEGMTDSDQLIKEFNQSLQNFYIINADASNGILLKYNCVHDSTTSYPPTIEASYEVLPNSEYTHQVIADPYNQLVLNSPNYPNQYPANAHYKWDVKLTNPATLFHLSFNELDLQSDHYLIISSFIDGKKEILMKVSGSELPDDLLIKTNSFEIEWSSQTKNLKLGRGFSINIISLVCGGIYKTSKGEINTPQTSIPPEYCLWDIDLHPTSLSNIKLDFSTEDQQTNLGDLVVYDGGKTLASPEIKINIVNGRANLTSKGSRVFIKSVGRIVMPVYKVQFTQNECPSALDRCANGICMHPEWKCNGINDCGDFSDEFNCLYYDCGNMNETYITEGLNISISNEISHKLMNCIWKLKASDEHKSMFVKIHSLYLNDARDVLIINDGESNMSPLLSRLTESSKNINELILVTSNRYLWINLFSDQKQFTPNFTIEVTPQSVGKRIHGSGNVIIKNQERNKINYFLLEADKGKQVKVSFSISNPALPNYALCFYDMLLSDEHKLDCFHSNDEIYPVYSSSNKMIVVAKNFHGFTSASLEIDNILQDNSFFNHASTGSLILTSVSSNIYTWRIKPTDGDIIALTIKHLGIQGKENVFVYEGVSESGKLIKEFDSHLENDYTIHGDATKGLFFKYICLHSASSSLPTIEASYEIHPKTEFSKDIEVVPYITPVEINSPNYPNQYPAHAFYKWNVMLPTSAGLFHIIFKDIELQPGHDLILSYHNNDSNIVLDFSGKHLPDDLIIENHSFDLSWSSRLSSKTTQLGRGFSTTVIGLVCGGSYNASYSEISTPLSTKSIIYCLWSIEVPSGISSNIRIDISSDHNEPKGKLFIYDGGKISSAQLPFTLDNGKAQVTSRESKVLVKYIPETEGVTSEYNLKFYQNVCHQKCGNGICMHPEWKCDGKNDCGDNTDEIDCPLFNCGNNNIILVNESMNLSVHLENFTQILNCNWILQAPENKSLIAKIRNVKLNYMKDVLLFEDGNNITLPILRKFINSSEKIEDTVLVSTGQILKINLFSDQAEFTPNFTAEIAPQDVGKHVHGCGNLTIKNQKPNVVSYFPLEAEEGKQIRVSFHVSNPALPNYKLCFYDSIFKPDNILDCFHSSVENYPVISTTNKMLVTAKNFHGFTSVDLNIENIPQGYNFISNSKTGSLNLSSVSNNTYEWHIKPIEEGVIVLAVKRLNLLEKESVLIFQGMSLLKNKILKEFKKPLDSTYIINSNAKEGIIFQYTSLHKSTDADVPIIEALYEVLPQKEFSKEISLYPHEEISINSYEYPNQYPLHSTCKWIITSINSSSNLTYIMFEDIDLQPHHQLVISTVDNGIYVPVVKVSGTNLPDDLLIASEQIQIQWSSNFINNDTKLGRGFNLKLRGIDCGGYLNNSQGTFTTGRNSSNVCVWIVSGPSRYSMIEFERKAESKKELQESLEIFDGGSSRSKLFHNSSSSSRFLSHSNKLLFRFNFVNTTLKEQDEIKIFYSVKLCDSLNERCQNNFCLHPDWLCNGVNDCGDNTDELNCTSVSPSGGGSGGSGVSTGWLIGAIFISLAVGVLLGVYLIPLVVKYIRSSRNKFQPLEASESNG